MYFSIVLLCFTITMVASTPVLSLSKADNATLSGREPGACLVDPDLTVGVDSSSVPMYVVGGWNFIQSPAVIFSDVWSTLDGISFTKTSGVGVGNRTLGGGAALGGSDLVVFGGISVIDANGVEQNSLDDVWMSSDSGTTFHLLTAHAGWTPRWGFAYTQLPKSNTIVISSGWSTYLNEGLRNFNDSNCADTWASFDGGQTWQRRGSTPFPALESPVMVALNDSNPSGYPTLLLTGGLSFSIQNSTLRGGSIIGHNAVWRSTDLGISWQNVNPSPPFSSRSGAGLLADLDNTVYLLFGWDSAVPAMDTDEADVWYTQDKGVTWSSVALLNDINSLSIDTFCCALRYVGTGASQTKQIVVFAGTVGKSYASKSTFTAYTLALTYSGATLTMPSLGLAILLLSYLVI